MDESEAIKKGTSELGLKLRCFPSKNREYHARQLILKVLRYGYEIGANTGVRMAPC